MSFHFRVLGGTNTHTETHTYIYIYIKTESTESNYEIAYQNTHIYLCFGVCVYTTQNSKMERHIK